MKSQYLEHEGIQIESGRTLDTSHINKFGQNPAVGQTFEPITDLGTNYLPDTAGVVSIVSASGNDTDGGTGAQSLEVQGLDASYHQVTEVVIMNGTSPVTTTTSFLRVFRLSLVSAGSGDTNAGNITASVGGTDIARIGTGTGQTLMAVYTVPARKRAYLVKFQGSISKSTEATFEIREKNGGVWKTKGHWGTFASTVTYDYPVPLCILEKTDIQVIGKANANASLGAIFDLILVDM